MKLLSFLNKTSGGENGVAIGHSAATNGLKKRFINPMCGNISFRLLVWRAERIELKSAIFLAVKHWANFRWFRKGFVNTEKDWYKFDWIDNWFTIYGIIAWMQDIWILHRTMWLAIHFYHPILFFNKFNQLVNTWENIDDLQPRPINEKKNQCTVHLAAPTPFSITLWHPIWFPILFYFNTLHQNQRKIIQKCDLFGCHWQMYRRLHWEWQCWCQWIQIEMQSMNLKPFSLLVKYVQ